MKGVFDIKVGSPYGDRPSERYYLDNRKDYEDLAKRMVDDWIIYRESKRSGGRKGYVGAARVISVDVDELGQSYAKVGDYIAFDPPVALSDNAGLYRESLIRLVQDSRHVGITFQNRSVRELSDSDFASIVADGLGATLSPDSMVRYGDMSPWVDDPQLPNPIGIPGADFVRRVETALVSRKVRKANFRRLVCRAYSDTCAVTGLRIINGGGRSEVQAAHIWPVEQGGPDVIQNGIALSGTMHWLFDRHLLSITDDYRLKVAHNRVPPELRNLFERQMERVILPKRSVDWPHPEYIRMRREHYGL
ncbi:MAG: HNH endonuclease [Alphaproteobacteria bacterium]|nr:HNH endonuclease [Alphaproteobacteria bacterium]MBU1527401.1 HNH endonuclease [Alphaproteobacteria bacterium]MBU2350806.1 HNH endonuclease [Alphaproteobacteria bacterium]MBU2381145.1 HNH endonuclease [Alphaproteobacteria bacterium]